MESRMTVPLTIATLLVVPVLIPQGSHVGEPLRAIAGVLDWAIWLAFVVELVTMLAVVDDRRRWLAGHPLDVAIVLVTPPFVSAAFQSIRVLRVARLLRLARVAQLGRGVFSLAGLRYASLLAVLTVIAGGEAFAETENVSVPDGLYWAATTMTTVGYGDISPTTDTGRAIAIVVMVVGIGFLTTVIGAIAERCLTSTHRREVAVDNEELLRELRALNRRLDALESRIETHQQDDRRRAA
jgi:voltage-gated potassium channel